MLSNVKKKRCRCRTALGRALRVRDVLRQRKGHVAAVLLTCFWINEAVGGGQRCLASGSPLWRVKDDPSTLMMTTSNKSLYYIPSRIFCVLLFTNLTLFILPAFFTSYLFSLVFITPFVTAKGVTNNSLVSFPLTHNS